VEGSKVRNKFSQGTLIDLVKRNIHLNYSNPINMKRAIVIFSICVLPFISCSKKKVNSGTNVSKDSTTLNSDGFPGVPQSSVYEVTITEGGRKKKMAVFESDCPVYDPGFMNMDPKDAYPLGIFKGRSISWANFSIDGSVQVEVKVLDENKVPVAGTVKILPSRYGITPAINGNIITFTIDKPGQFSVEIGNNGYKNGLMIFANPAETDIPDTITQNYAVIHHGTEDIMNSLSSSYSGIYFKKGVHSIGVYHVPANIKNIYFEDSSWVYGALIMDGNPGVKIFGRGVLSSAKLNYRESHCVEAINQSDNIDLEGIVIADQKFFAVRLIGKNNIVKWIKTIGGWTYNCDGIAAYEGSTISNCFVWANDDNLKIYRDHISISNCVCWQLNNGGIFQLSWGNGNSTNVNISHIDILHGEWNNDQVNRGIVSCVGDKFAVGGMYGLQQNFLFDDVITETAVPLVFRLSPNAASPDEIHGMIFKDWQVKMDMGDGYSNYIICSDSTKKFDELVFDNFIFNGTKLTPSNWISVGNFQVENIITPEFK
jgi:hypothetical protein